jgi:ketopantoate reductase
MARPRRYAVLGSGAIGCVYGSRLWGAGHPVRFGLRSDLATGLARGLKVESPWGGVGACRRIASAAALRNLGRWMCCWWA